MSEYQYYEFLAMDRPLTAEEMADLRALSTRAHITPVSFTNEYNWGDFSGDPSEVMERFFDAHVYVANWMTAIFMVRVPIGALSEKTVKALAVYGMLDFKATKTHWVITWSLCESENYDRFGMEDGRGWMARLAPVRDELVRGDLRSLYIGWLAAVSMQLMDDDTPEPLPVEGLGSMTFAQKGLAEFLEVNPDLLAGAGIGSPALPDEASSKQEMDEWVEGLPKDEVSKVLKQLLTGRGQLAERMLKNRFEAWRHGLRGDKTEAPGRMVGELWKNADAAQKMRLEEEKRERKRQETKRRKEREAYLKTLSKDFPEAWKAVQRTLKRRSGLAYDEACLALVDLSEAYALHESRGIFQQALKEFMAGHMRRKALIQRLVKAGIWKDK